MTGIRLIEGFLVAFVYDSYRLSREFSKFCTQIESYVMDD